MRFIKWLSKFFSGTTYSTGIGISPQPKVKCPYCRKSFYSRSRGAYGAFTGTGPGTGMR